MCVGGGDMGGRCHKLLVIYLGGGGKYLVRLLGS